MGGRRVVLNLVKALSGYSKSVGDMFSRVFGNSELEDNEAEDFLLQSGQYYTKDQIDEEFEGSNKSRYSSSNGLTSALGKLFGINWFGSDVSNRQSQQDKLNKLLAYDYVKNISDNNKYLPLFQGGDLDIDNFMDE